MEVSISSDIFRMSITNIFLSGILKSIMSIDNIIGKKFDLGVKNVEIKYIFADKNFLITSNIDSLVLGPLQFNECYFNLSLALTQFKFKIETQVKVAI